ncbi:MAG: hypothetical protein JWM76_722, partial [Pseudonocardiales bacterium]|nr:hypothetical protein [Pseudonocardiales bacterium]
MSHLATLEPADPPIARSLFDVV